MWRVQTDTASVLHEAATCIKHLHEQIQVSRWRIVLLLTQNNGHATLGHEEQQICSKSRFLSVLLVSLSIFPLCRF